jgi:hypothetical protein
MNGDQGDRRPAMPRGRLVGSGVDWNFPITEGLINNRGEDVIHETGMRCICVVEDTMAGQIKQVAVPRRRVIVGCPRCNGDGYIFRNPRKVTAMITGISETRERLEQGWSEPGDCIMSVRPGYQVTAGDMVTFTWGQPVPDGQVLIRGAGQASENSSRETGLAPNEDRLWYAGSDSIWCEDEDGNTYTDGDFRLDGSKIITWLGRQPADGKRYVIKYNAYLEWIAFQHPNVRRDRGRDLGGRVMLRKRHVVLLNNDPHLRVGDRVPFCARLQAV